MSRQLTKDSPIGRAIMAWWEGLEQNKGGRADLRRASTVFEALMCPAFQVLQRQLVAISPESFSQPYQLDRLAISCALLAHVRTHSEGSLPSAMSHRAPGEERNPVSELRFKRLLESYDDEDLFTGLRRILPLLDWQVDVLSLVSSVLYWGPVIKRHWAYEYHWL